MYPVFVITVCIHRNFVVKYPIRFVSFILSITVFIVMKQVRDMIQPTQPGENVVGSFIEKHIQVDLKHISQCCSENADDCLLLVHDIINNMASSE